MSSRTKIIVLHMKEIIYTVVFALLAIVLILLLVFMFRPGRDSSHKEEARYVPGVYTSAMSLNNTALEVEVTVDESHINSIRFSNLDETVAAMYPLIQPEIENIAQQVYEQQSLENVTLSQENPYTSQVILNAIRELRSLGIAVYFELQDINTLTTAGELMLTIKGAFAQGESDDASALARMAIRRKFSNLERLAATDRTYGFQTGSDGELEVNESEASVVRLMFNLAEKGVWPSKIKQFLNANKVPAPSGGEWDDTGIARVLHNVMYKGDLILQKTVKDHRRISRPNRGEADQWYIKDDHPAIVSVEQWETVQSVLADRREHLDTPLPPPPKEPRSSHVRYPLSDLLYCPHCGAKLIHKWSKGSREYWACRTNVKVSASACKGIWLPAPVANAWVGISEPVTVIPYQDEYFMQRFTAIPKVEFDTFSDCPYREGA